MAKQRRPYTPEETAEMLKKHGTIVTVEQAKAILSAMRHLAKLTIEQTFKEDDFDENIELLKDVEGASQLIEIQVPTIHLLIALKEVLALGTGAGLNWILC
ncbi:hypothetical protein [Mucilaginibacter dorajii]|uniref:Uncharacterized protein n=1 Tax=Mucilaginibacter dorajii TaxID=692994 RepID=A0ABP7PAR3_9SPHI|nr:hypothetical protein [Mucilaginibacter dorajii]MCS3735154.1 hypothetical protein [Mucilaginibacter dorajii]